MDEERQVNPDTETEGGESVDTDNNDASEQESSSEDFKQLYENQKKRAEKAERRAKELEATGTDTSRQTDSDTSRQSEQTTQTAESSTPKQDALSREEAILFAQGHSEEEVEFAHKVSQLEGITLREATSNDIFTTWKSKKEQEEKQKEAQLGASRGSGGKKKTKSVSDPGLTKEEHKKLWRPLS